MMPGSSRPCCPICFKNNSILWAVAKDVEYSTGDLLYKYFLCLNCDVLFIFPVPYDLLKDIYPNEYYSYNKGQSLFIGAVKSFCDKVFFRSICKGFKNKNLKALDVGGGVGAELTALRSADKRFTFTQIIDLNENAKLIAENAGHNYFCGKLEDFTVSHKFDLILMLNLIEHVWNPAVILQKARDLLAENGIILLKTPNFRSLDSFLFKNKNWAGYHCPRHWVIFNDKSFYAFANQNQLNVKNLSFTQGAPFWAASILGNMPFCRHFIKKPLYQSKAFPFLCLFFGGLDTLRKVFSKTSQMFIILNKSS